jgi:CysZ protein
MTFFSGISYNLRGLALGVRTPKLFLLGFLRFFILVLFTILLCIWAWAYRQELIGMVWSMPAEGWLLWVWYPVSWLISLLLFMVAAFFAYVIAQITFSVIIMDAMSRITEKMFTGKVVEAEVPSRGWLFIELIKQEIPRAIIPTGVLMVVMVVGWLTPFGPIVSLLSSVLVAVFLSWDHTDLPAARRRVPFRQRIDFLLKTIPFHIGFGLLFLIPVANALFLSFAPVGATLFQIARDAEKK